jgi:hypothetical protein
MSDDNAAKALSNEMMKNCFAARSAMSRRTAQNTG